MTKRTFGFAAALVFSISPAWADLDSGGDSAGGDGIYEDAGGRAQEWGRHKAEAARERVAIAKSDSGGYVEPAAIMPDAGRDTRALQESEEVRASFEERSWLLDREGYRDGGY